jgi:hypothetical protein
MRYNGPTKCVMLSALILLPTLNGCAPQIQTPEIKSHASFCEIAKKITFSRLNDTEQTIKEIKEHNAVFAELCERVSP